ncbi:MAG: hypothetical protein WA210_10025 [Burkholderiaceae bacterium]
MSWLAFALALAAVGLGVSLWRIAPGTLKFDGSDWLLGNADADADAEGSEPIAGDLEVCLDLGCWMLLRFIPAAKGAGTRSHWLPAQLGAHDSQWHAFRCAIYSSRPTARDAAASAAEGARDI